MKTGSKIAAIMLSIVALLHLLRVWMGKAIIIGEWEMPYTGSILAAAVLFAVVYLLVRDGKS